MLPQTFCVKHPVHVWRRVPPEAMPGPTAPRSVRGIGLHIVGVNLDCRTMRHASQRVKALSWR
jgi:hypothetical protein